MPLSNGFRSRRSTSGKTRVRRLSSLRTGLGGLAQLLPRTLIFPIILFAGVTATAAAFWTYDIHVEQALSELEDQEMNGSVDSAN